MLVHPPRRTGILGRIRGFLIYPLSSHPCFPKVPGECSLRVPLSSQMTQSLQPQESLHFCAKKVLVDHLLNFTVKGAQYGADLPCCKGSRAQAAVTEARGHPAEFPQNPRRNMLF